MSITDRPATAISWLVKPMKDTTSTLLLASGTLITNFPSESVDVPVEVPFNNTDAPGIDAPSTLDVTLPETVCAMAEALASKSKTVSFSKRFFI
jgi:hypothetical protein